MKKNQKSVINSLVEAMDIDSTIFGTLPKEWKLKSGERVVNRHQSHLHSDVERLLPEALGKIDSSGRQFIIEEVDFGRLVGETVCVPTTDTDRIVFAYRPGRAGLSRFVENCQPEPCSSVIVILKKATTEPGLYILITAFIGRTPEPEPWDRNATEFSVTFWKTHALVWGSEPVICYFCRENISAGEAITEGGDVALCHVCAEQINDHCEGTACPSTLVEFPGWGQLYVPAPEDWKE